MGPVDYVVILIIALIVGGASYYIYRAKKQGKKCIGCPYSSSCGKNGDTCQGHCSACSKSCSDKE